MASSPPQTIGEEQRPGTDACLPGWQEATVLPRLRAVYFGSATSAITRDMTAAEVAQLFEEGAVCVRGFCVLTGKRAARGEQSSRFSSIARYERKIKALSDDVNCGVWSGVGKDRSGSIAHHKDNTWKGHECVYWVCGIAMM